MIDDAPEAPPITVVTPAYNAGRHVAACLRSLQAQSFESWRCMVVDDGSADDTVDRVAELADPRVQLLRQKNMGVSTARNRGLAQVRGPFVMFLDSDDTLHPTALERLHRGAVAEPGCVAAYGAFRKTLTDGTPYPGQTPLSRIRHRSGDVLEAMLRQNFLANGGHVLVRVEAARAIGGFDTRLRLSEDWEFWCRLAALGPFHAIPLEPECLYLRVAAQSCSGGLAQDWANHLPALTAVLDNAALAKRFAPRRWRALGLAMRASHLFEAGRVNFTLRRFKLARSLMLRSLRARPTAKTLAIFAIAQASQLLDRALISRLRFQRDDHSAAVGLLDR